MSAILNENEMVICALLYRPLLEAASSPLGAYAVIQSKICLPEDNACRALEAILALIADLHDSVPCHSLR